MKPQDLLTALKIIVLGPAPWNQHFLSAQLGISQSEISRGLKRLTRSGLYRPQTRCVDVQKLKDFIEFGAPVLFQLAPTGYTSSPARFTVLPETTESSQATLRWGWSASGNPSPTHGFAPFWKSLEWACALDDSLSDLIRVFEMSLILPEPYRRDAFQQFSDRISYYMDQKRTPNAELAIPSSKRKYKKRTGGLSIAL